MYGQVRAAALPLGRVDSGEAGDVAVAVDPVTGHLYADDQSSVAEWDTGAMNRNSAPSNDNSALARSSRASARRSCRALAGEGGIAVDGGSGEIYVSNPADGKVYVFAQRCPRRDSRRARRAA